MAGPDRAPKPKQKDGPVARAATAATVDPNLVTNGMGGGESRLSQLPSFLDVGEQVFGSSHVFDLPAPFNLTGGSAKLVASVADGTPFSVESCLRWLVQVVSMSTGERGDLGEQLANPVRVRFSPRAGDAKRETFNGELWLTATWPDGHVEAHRVSLVGGAREQSEAPSPTRAEREAAARTHDAEQAEEATANKERAAFWANRKDTHVPSWAYERYDSASRSAQISTAALARRQRTGITVLQAEILAYKAPPIERAVWWDLAKAAITLATTVLATYVGGAAASALVGAFEIAGGVGLGAVASEAAPSGLEKALAIGIRDALKQVAAAVLATFDPTHDDATTNASAAFLKLQLDALDKMETRNSKIAEDYRDRNLALLHSNPEVAVGVMEAVDHSFSKSADVAEDVQMSATAGEWLAFKARATAGAVTVGSRKNDESPVTDMTKATAKSIAGVLEIRVDVDGKSPRVRDARVMGIAQAVADHLGTLDLRTARLPMKFNIGWNEPNPTIVTRDEEGRLFVTGDLRRLVAGSSDHEWIDDAPQADLAARELIELVLSRTLSDWGVSISTDDRSAKEAK